MSKQTYRLICDTCGEDHADIAKGSYEYMEPSKPGDICGLEVEDDEGNISGCDGTVVETQEVDVLREGQYSSLPHTLINITNLDTSFMAKPRKPFVGANVQYRDNGEKPIGGIRAAIITRVNDAELVDLMVFSPNKYIPQRVVLVEQGDKPGQWRWPVEDE